MFNPTTTEAAQAEATYRRQHLAEVYRERRVLRPRHHRGRADRAGR